MISVSEDLAVRRVVALNNPDKKRSINRRWQTAAAIVSGAATPWFFRKVIDADVKLAVRYLRRRRKQSVKFKGSLAYLHRAWELRYHADVLTRAILEARLLAGQTIAETAAACDLAVEVLRLYESLFFNVSDCLGHRAYIIGETIGPRYWTGYSRDDVDIILKSAAYLKGPMYLEYILPYFTTPWTIPDRLETLTLAELTLLTRMIFTRAMIEGTTASTRDTMRAFVRIAFDEPATQWEGLAQELGALADAAFGQKSSNAIGASLSSASIRQLVDAFRPAPAATEMREPLRKVG